MISRYIFAILAMVAATVPSRAGDVQFDPGAAVRERMVDEAIGRAESCVRSMILVNLHRGTRDRKTLVEAAVAQCENDLTAYLARVDPKFADRPTIHAALISSGYQQLDEVLARGE